MTRDVSWLGLLIAASSTTVGTNVHLPPADVLDLAADLGGGWVRIDLNWDIAQPQPGAFDWTVFDAVIDNARARGLQVYATMGYTPAWASTGNRHGDASSNDVPDSAAYRAFVEAAVARYRDRVAVFGTWNEPNLGDFFEGTKQEWIDVVYRPAILGIRAQCPDCTIAGPEVATIGDQYDDYIRAALAVEHPTILSAHIYASFTEDDSAAGTTKDSFLNKLEARRTIGGIAIGQPSIRESMLAAGADLPIWITETGRQATSDNASQLESQRLFTQRVLDAMEARSWWAGTIFYELTEEHPGGLWPDIHWGLALRTADPDASPLDNFAAKPAYDYLKQRLAAAPPAGDAGPTNPPGGAPDDAGPAGGGDAGLDDSPAPAGCGCQGPSTPGAELLGWLGLAMLLRRRKER